MDYTSARAGVNLQPDRRRVRPDGSKGKSLQSPMRTGTMVGWVGNLTASQAHISQLDRGVPSPLLGRGSAKNSSTWDIFLYLSNEQVL